ncbi:polysaccharide deacetylase family protein [uncultured Clostridium sp.]|uniref:polysaccharide deacetylase family protein n=1 Tax=uncultured Clostridium sp. TaxID=59620 RepID=UPI0026219304|nr:polysaccharide deacetylase family protein [uncultured Clostridium sp.]
MKKIILIVCLIFITFPSATIFANTLTEKSIYLTFDDGISSKVTNEILNILESEGIKGTFFIMGNTLKENTTCLNRLINDNHAIGLHSFSHNRDILYSSKEAFINEMTKTNDLLLELTGTTSNIIRFPFGTYNDTFKLSKPFEIAVHDNNFKIYDWNVDSLDGQNPYNTAYNIYKNSISKKDNIILLMHCTDLNKNSVVALKQIIDYYKSNNYVFKTITTDTPEMYKLKNDRDITP